MKLPLQLDNLRAQLEVARRDAERVTAGWSEAELWQRPPDGGWSVGECLAHLNLVGEAYATRLRPVLAEAAPKARSGGGRFRLGLVGGLLVRSVSPDTRARLKAPPTFQPGRQADVTERFLGLQDELSELVRRAKGLDLGRIKLASPVSRYVRLSAFEALNAVVVHEARHLQQAGRVRAALGANEERRKEGSGVG